MEHLELKDNDLKSKLNIFLDVFMKHSTKTLKSFAVKDNIVGRVEERFSSFCSLARVIIDNKSSGRRIEFSKNSLKFMAPVSHIRISSSVINFDAGSFDGNKAFV